jgi:cyclopropane fatty-acyl-phospholipid synthase-like methyltransferase
MHCCPAVQPRSIRGHYDLSTIFYRLFWGPHIHHGYWDRDEPARVAQVQLIERLADACGITSNDRLLDVGCGMGGSSIHLAKMRRSQATGVTISGFQRRWAVASARWHGVHDRTQFLCDDAESVTFSPKSFDVVWSVECTEHLFDKPQFFERSAQWVKPGGHVAICAWLAGDDLQDETHLRQVDDVCEGFFCPSLGTRNDYCKWMEDAGLEMIVTEDWTTNVARTWELCQQRIDRSKVRWLAKLIDRDTVMFLDRFDTLLQAYRNGAMRYGCFVARKPLEA